MRGKFVISLSVLFVAAVGATNPSAAEDDRLTVVKRLYAAAQYADALDVLDNRGAEIPVDDADEYRALCLIAIDRPGDAERVLETLITRRPDLRLDGADRSPKIVALFRTVQRRALPAALKRRYAAAKTDFDAGRTQAAVAGFNGLLALIGSSAAVLEPETAADLRTLAEGFVRLAAPPPPAPAAPPAVAADTVAPRSPRSVFDDRDAEVVPPVPIAQAMPQWTPPRALQAHAFSGLLEIVIDEKGAVVSRAMLEPSHPLFDTALLDAAAKWKFKPATLDGRSVKYRKTIAVKLSGGR
jgi:TonB family protein